jgi:hypothetical protein
MTTTTKINSFPLSNTDVLFFDIFFKNNKIYLILPIYNEPYSTDDIIIKMNGNKDPIQITTKYMKNQYEPILIYIYDYFVVDNANFNAKIQLTVEYKNIIKEFELEHIVTTEIQKHSLTLTTLFKDDYKLFPFFYDYYKKQGVSHFYMYYNGKITPEIQKFLGGIIEIENDVTLIEWDYIYWNDMTLAKNKYQHHAQLGQIHHAIYKYGKDINDYMIFCDFDEYLHIPNNTLLGFIMQYPDIDVVGFRNKWAEPVNYFDNSKPNTFPSKLITSKPFRYGERSKNIYKLSSINTISIHFGHTYTKPNLVGYTDFFMYQFYKWTNSERITRESCDIIEDYIS